jgi:phosphoribosylanthranilate isomerase
MKVKVCGITSYEDAAMALDQGVDALGFNFFPRSPRYVSPMAVRRIIERLPPFAVIVGLFVNVPQQEDVSEMARVAGIQVVQLHGDESPEYCRRLGEWPLIKALRIGKSRTEDNLEDYPVRAFLLDSKDDVLFGGTGKSFDWNRALEVKKVRPVILAGGLRPDNVQEAIRTVMPYAVDVCSGVESAPGKKDGRRLKEFMDEVRNVSDNLQRP